MGGGQAGIVADLWPGENCFRQSVTIWYPKMGDFG